MKTLDTSECVQTLPPETAPARRRFVLLRKSYQEGVWAVLLALLPALLVTLLFRTPNPLNPLVERVMEWTPVDVAVILLQVLGIWAKPFALWGGFAIAMVAGGLAGALYPWRDRQLGYASTAEITLRLVLLLALAGGTFALLARPQSLVTMIILYAGTIALIHYMQSRPQTSTPLPARRAFLRESVATLGIVLALSGLSVGDMLLRQLKGIGRTTVKLFDWSPPPPRKPDIANIEGITQEVTPVPQFYIMSKNLEDPGSAVGLDDAIADGTWALEVTGHVDRPLRLSIEEIKALSRRDQYVTMECISNTVGGSLMSTAYFSGVPLRLILERAGMRPGALKIAFRAPDDHTDSLPVALAMQDEVLLAYGMNGSTLSYDHGYPLRLHVPGIYGFKNVKWLTQIEVTTENYQGHWQQRGWTDDATIHTTSRIDVIRPEDGKLLLAGIALAGTRGISQVEVRREGDPSWTPAELHTPPLSGITWIQWRAWLPFIPGEGRYQVRATDGTGAPQSEKYKLQFPDGAEGLHSVYVKF
jgi:DMSO/TMAO reductase YedYZ molybdopterin-dependent catalytic subunit